MSVNTEISRIKYDINQLKNKGGGSTGVATSIQTGTEVLSIGAINDGEFLVRSGDSVIGEAIGGSALARTVITWSSDTYQCENASSIYVVTEMTADSVILLPSAITVGAGAQLSILDESGQVHLGPRTSNAYLLKITAVFDQTIDGYPAGLLLHNRTSVSFVSDGANWYTTYSEHFGVDPRAISGLSGWWSATHGVTLNATRVSALADLSGNGLPLSTVNASYQPLWFCSSVSRMPTLFFDGTDGLIATTNSTISDSVSIFASILRMTNTAAPRCVFAHYPGGNLSLAGLNWYYRQSNQLDWLTGDMVLWANGYTSGRAPRCIAPWSDFLDSSSDTNICKDNITLSVRTGNGSTITSLFRTQGKDLLRTYADGVLPSSTGVYSLGYASGAAEYWAGPVSEVFIYQPGLTDAQHTSLEVYMARKYRSAL